MNPETSNTNPTSKKAKLKTDSIRVKKETKKKIQAEVGALNKKDFGRPITVDDYVALAITLLRPEHLDQLRDRCLSNKDRLEQRYREYCSANGRVSKDEFIGVLLVNGAASGLAERRSNG